MVSRDSKGREKGYKRLFDLGMEIEQAGELMNTNNPSNPSTPSWLSNRTSTPSWLNDFGGTGWHSDGSGPMEFSTPIARKNTASLFKRFSDCVPPNMRWKWHGENCGSSSNCQSNVLARETNIRAMGCRGTVFCLNQIP